MTFLSSYEVKEYLLPYLMLKKGGVQILTSYWRWAWKLEYGCHPFLTIEKAKILGNTFTDSPFNYTRLLWMFCGKTVYSKIEKIHQKSLIVIYESNNTYDNLLLQSNTVSVHHRHLRFLVTEYIKACRN